MNGFEFACPACGQNVLGDTAHIGMQVSCPHCQAQITIPSSANSTPAVQKTSRLAITSLVCSLTCLGCLPAIICGHMAKMRIRRDGLLKGMGLANAGLIIGYLTLVNGLAGIGYLAYKAAVVSKQVARDFQTQMTQLQNSNAIPSTAFTNASAETHAQTDANTSAEPQKNATTGDSVWTLNLDKAQFPDQPAGGKFRGTDFLAQNITYRNETLILEDAAGSAFVIKLNLQKADPLEGTSFHVGPNDIDPSCKVTLRRKIAGKNRVKKVANGYAMKLEFGAGDKKKIPGKIYLCLPGSEKNYIAGTFTVGSK